MYRAGIDWGGLCVSLGDGMMSDDEQIAWNRKDWWILGYCVECGIEVKPSDLTEDQRKCGKCRELQG